MINRDSLFWNHTDPTFIHATLEWAETDKSLMPFHRAINNAYKLRQIHVLCGVRDDSVSPIGFYTIEESGFVHKRPLLTCFAVHPRYRRRDYFAATLSYRSGPDYGFGWKIWDKVKRECFRLPTHITVHQKSMCAPQLSRYQSRLYPKHYGDLMFLGDDDCKFAPRNKLGELKTFADYPQWYDLELRGDA